MKNVSYIHEPKTEIPKLGWIWDSIPKQLAKDNNKFVFSHVKEGKRSNELEEALEWLVEAGLVHKLELDFLFEYEDKIIPVEAKTEGNTRAKSYAQYCKKYNPKLGFKFSMKQASQVSATWS